jgi:2-oxo-4-hydroxy-4-carboxy--5-ureidoimidazoline (OHCU) decarboxylase
MEIILAIAIAVLVSLCYVVRVRERTKIEIARIVERRLTDTDENWTRLRIVEIERERRLLEDGSK